MARGTPVSCHIPRVPQKSPSIPGKPFFRALPRLSSRGSTHTTVARGTALWESLVEKPRGKASWESLVGQPRGKASWESLVGKPRGKASDPFIHGKGSGTLLLQLGRKPHVHAPTRNEDRLPRGDSRSTPRSMSALERNPQVPAPTPRKVLGPGIDGRGIPRGPRATCIGTGLS